MIIVIDNYDSFVHNLARYVGMAGHEYRVVRNDSRSIADIAEINPEAIILSPGPKAPQDAGISLDLIKTLAPSTPILGVCLGHQCIGEAFGGKTIQTEPVHGRASTITHDGKELFAGIPSPMKGGRYHSLMSVLPDETQLQVTARCTEGHIMAMRHREFPTYGVQFHPESVLTEYGMVLVRNFSIIVKCWHRMQKVAA